MSSNIVIRNIESQDYSDYLSLMKEFHGYDYNISYELFSEVLTSFNQYNFCNIYVLYEKTINKIIGAGSIYKLIKLHNNPVGQIEDVIISEKHRGYGYGKMIIDKQKAFFLFYNDVMICTSDSIGVLYEKYKILNKITRNDDQIFYITLTLENTFG